MTDWRRTALVEAAFWRALTLLNFRKAEERVYRGVALPISNTARDNLAAWRKCMSQILAPPKAHFHSAESNRELSHPRAALPPMYRAGAAL